MSELRVNVEMDNNLTETQKDRLSDTSSTKSNGSRKRISRAVSTVEENDDRIDIFNPDSQIEEGLLSAKGNYSPIPNGGITPISRDDVDENGKKRPRTIMVDGIETQVPDINAYQHKKTLAQGMMDLALLSANANQLRYVLESYNRHPFFYPSLIFISLSIILQVAVGVGLILNSQYNIQDEREICKANRISNMTIIGIFIITVVNVFISSFGVADAPPST